MSRICTLSQFLSLSLVVSLNYLQRLKIIALHSRLEGHGLDHGQPNHKHLTFMYCCYIFILAVFYSIQLLRSQQTHRRRILQHYFIGCFPSIDKIRINQLRIPQMIKQYITSLDISMTSSIILQKFKYRYNSPKNLLNFLLRHPLIFMTILLHNILKWWLNIVILQIQLKFIITPTTKWFIPNLLNKMIPNSQ